LQRANKGPGAPTALSSIGTHVMASSIRRKVLDNYRRPVRCRLESSYLGVKGSIQAVKIQAVNRKPLPSPRIAVPNFRNGNYGAALT